MNANMSTEITTLNTGVSIFDKGVFESLWRVAEAMANSSLVPKSLTEDKSGPFPLEKITANCFLVCEQSQRWGLSPFACLGCASVVHGRLMWEGKLVSAVLDAKLGVRLDYDYSGSGESLRVVVKGTLPGETEPRTVTGTVAQWKTTGAGSPWTNPADHERQLSYRGAREWARRHAPAVILGVYTKDEMEDAGMRDVTPKRPLERAKRIEPSKQATPKEAPKEAPAKAEKQVTKAEDHPAGKPVKSVKAWIESHATQEGESKGKPWKLHSVGLIVDGKHVDAKTFSETLGSLAEFNVDRPCVVALEETPKGIKLASLEIVDEEEGGLL